MKDNLNQTSKQIEGLIVDVTPQEREIIIKQLEEEYTWLLEGYTINKNKYTDLSQLDPKELIEINKNIKQQLNNNEKFYLHGDFNLT
jgi:hypothetical protein